MAVLYQIRVIVTMSCVILRLNCTENTHGMQGRMISVVNF